jgi:hypothetical protein
VKELRNAIDAVRNSAGLPPYAPASGEGWTGWPSSYSNATGPILAVHMGAMRRALEEAISQLVKVVRHQNPRRERPAEPSHGHAEEEQKRLPIAIRAEDGPALVAAGGNVVESIVEFES